MTEQNAKCATLTSPSLPALPAVPEGTNSSTDRLADFQPAREKPEQPINPDEDNRWLVGYRINRMNNTAILGGFNPALTQVLRSKRWATLVRDEGWVVPLRYLAHVEKLLYGADVDLFDVEGAPTPGQRLRERQTDRAQSRQALAEIRAEREKFDARAAHDEARRTRQAFADALAAKHARDRSEVTR